MNKLILISIKDQYVQKILSGDKTIELRKSKPSAKIGDIIIIYTTKPIKAVTAIASIKDIISCTPSQMWEDHNQKLGIDEENYNNYYSGAKKAIGLELTNVIKLDAEILLSAIKLLNPHFQPPQTFKYLNKFGTLRDFNSLKKKKQSK